jgi:hypothetical protein
MSEQTHPINLFGRMHNLADAMLYLHEYCVDNGLDKSNGPSLEDFAYNKWSGLDLDDIEKKICEAVQAIDLLSGRDTERVIEYTLTGETDADE